MSPRARLAVVALILLGGWLFLSAPGSNPLTATCDPDGMLERARAAFQGERYWHSVGVLMEHQQAETGASALLGCRATIFGRAGMEVEGPAR